MKTLLESHTDYEKQGMDFLQRHSIKFKTKFIKQDLYFVDDKEARDIYSITFTKGPHNSMSLRFGQSLVNSNYGKNPPVPYDVLSCLARTDPGTFESFCSEFGCNTDSIKDLKVYKSVRKEWGKVNRFFSLKEIEELQDIQ